MAPFFRPRAPHPRGGGCPVEWLAGRHPLPFSLLQIPPSTATFFCSIQCLNFQPNGFLQTNVWTSQAMDCPIHCPDFNPMDFYFQPIGLALLLMSGYSTQCISLQPMLPTQTLTFALYTDTDPNLRFIFSSSEFMFMSSSTCSLFSSHLHSKKPKYFSLEWS